jgi:hypothetical protein
MRTQRFEGKVTYWDTREHKEACEADAMRQGKTMSEWYRAATRDYLAKGRRERLREMERD